MEARERKEEVTYGRKSAILRMDIWRPEFRLAGNIFAHENALHPQKWAEEWNWQEPSNLYACVKPVQLLCNAFQSSPIAVIVTLRLWMSYRCALSRDYFFCRALWSLKVSLKGLEIGSPESVNRFSRWNNYQRIPVIFSVPLNCRVGCFTL